MAAFRIESGEFSRDYRANRASEFRNDIQTWWNDWPDTAAFIVNGQQVSKEQAIAHVDAIDATKLEKKQETHRLISWKQGACENTRRWKWVRKTA